MKAKLVAVVDRLVQGEGFLWTLLIVQLIFYWAVAFLASSGNELVAYQRY